MASKIDPFKHLLGKVPDERIAEMAGVKVETVAAYRRKNEPELEEPALVAEEGDTEPDGTPIPAGTPIYEQDPEPELELEVEPEVERIPRVIQVTKTYRRPGEGVDSFVPRSIFKGAMAAKIWGMVPHDLIEVIEW